MTRLLLIAALAVLPASANVLYSNFDVGMGFDSTNGWVVDGADFNDQVFSQSFESPISAHLTDVDMRSDSMPAVSIRRCTFFRMLWESRGHGASIRVMNFSAGTV